MDVFRAVVAEVDRVRRAAAMMTICSGVVVAGWILPATVKADPTNDPCTLAMAFFCRFLPIAPDLDGDVDLTTQVPPANPAAPPLDPPPADVCAAAASSTCH